MSAYALLMAKATRRYFHENFDGAETANIQPSKSFPAYGICNINIQTCVLTLFRRHSCLASLSDTLHILKQSPEVASKSGNEPVCIHRDTLISLDYTQAYVQQYCILFIIYGEKTFAFFCGLLRNHESFWRILHVYTMKACKSW